MMRTGSSPATMVRLAARYDYRGGWREREIECLAEALQDDDLPVPEGDTVSRKAYERAVRRKRNSQ